MNISNDSYAILLLCSDLGIGNLNDGVKPFTTSQWSNLAKKLIDAKLTPKSLLELSSDGLKEKLILSSEEINRIDILRSRGGVFAIELSELNEKGILTLTRADKNYPIKLKDKLRNLAPPVIYYAGSLKLLENRSISIVGSRNIDEIGEVFTEQLSKKCTNDGLNIISGGARGVDTIAENVANDSEGTTIIVVSSDMQKKIRNKATRNAIINKQSLIISAVRPDRHFSAYLAMERNKYIYALSDFAVVISSDYNKGGTWSGAKENLKRGLVPLFVRKDNSKLPKGNTELLKEAGVRPLTKDIIKQDKNIFEVLQKKSETMYKASKNEQTSLFDSLNNIKKKATD